MRTTSTRNILSALALGATLLAGGAIAATSTTPAEKPAPAVQAQRELSLAQVSEKLTAAGYTSISKIERERSVYEVRATDKAGARVKLKVDPKTGEILNSRQKSRDHDDND